MKKFDIKDLNDPLQFLENCYNDLIYLSDAFFPHLKQDPITKSSIPEAEIHKEFETLLRNSIATKNDPSFNNLLAILPRGLAKSTYSNIFFLVWCLLFTNKRYIVMVGASSNSISKHFNNLKNEIENNTLLNTFGIVFDTKGVNNKDKMDVIGTKIPGIKYLTKQKTVRIEMYGAQGFPRGLNNNGNRPDLIIIDDLEQKKQGKTPGVESPTYRAEIRDLFEATILYSGFNHTQMQVIMLGTIMSEAQLLYQLYDQNMKGIYSPAFKCIKYSMIEDYGTPYARSIWPEKYSLEYLEKELEKHKYNGTESIFYNELLSQPTSPDDEIFFEKDFQYFSLRGGTIHITDKNGDTEIGSEKINLRNLSVVVSSDLAFTQNEKSDDSVIVVAATDGNDEIYILDVLYGKWLLTEQINKFREVIRQYNPAAIGIEDAAGGKVIIQTLEREFQNEKNFKGIIALKHGGIKKHDRIINKLQIPFYNGKVHFNVDKKYVDDLKYQILSVTKDGIKSKHDDLVDALSYIYDMTDYSSICNYYDEEDYYEYDIVSNYL